MPSQDTDDLAAGVVRAVGDPGERFAEDSLRLLRAVRFSARFGFPIDRATHDAMVAGASSITRVTGGVAAGLTLPVLVLMKSAPPAMASHEARRTLSSVASSPVSMITLRWAVPHAAFTWRISSSTSP